ncbi:MAG: DinB family protein [Bacillota bacterium]
MDAQVDVKAIVLKTLRFERRLTRESVAAMADADMNFQPTPEQMAFGQQALHILSAYATLLGALAGQGWVWDQGLTLEKYPTREAILQLYDEETARLERFLEELAPERFGEIIQTGWGTQESLAQILIDWIAHECHHRGQMVVYLRLREATPPRY